MRSNGSVRGLFGFTSASPSKSGTSALRAAAVGSALVVLVAACGDSATGPDPEPLIESVELSAPSFDLIEHDSVRVSAIARSARGDVLPGRAFTWRSDSAHVATVDTAGLIRAVGPGVTRVHASSGGRSASASVRVARRPVDTVELSSYEADITVGDTIRLIATARSASGAPLPGRPVAWASDRVDVATVDDEGLISGQDEGVAYVTAIIEGISATAEVRVAPAPVTTPVVVSLEPNTIQAGWSSFTMVVRGSGFVPQSRVTWEDVPLETFYRGPGELWATVSPSYVARQGVAAVRVETPVPEHRVSNAETFTIFSRPAFSVELRVPGNAVIVGDVVRLSAVARDQFGEIIEGKTIEWSSSDTTVAKVEGEYLRGLRAGSVHLVASAYPTFSGITYFVVDAPAPEIVFQGRATTVTEVFGRTLSPPGGVRRMLPPVIASRQPEPSPDGTKIAFVGVDAGGNEDIYVADVGGANRVRLTTAEGPDDQPAWSPDGTRIAFRSFRHGKSDVWVMNADGSDQRNLTHADVFVPEEYNQRPSWAPDSERLVFSRDAGIGSALFTIRADGTGLALLASWAGLDMLEPAWSPDGAVIAFRSHDRALRSSRIGFVDPSGESVYVLTPPPAEATTPTWVAPGWLAVSAPVIPASEVRTVALVSLGFALTIVPMGEEFGTLEEPAVLRR